MNPAPLLGEANLPLDGGECDGTSKMPIAIDNTTETTPIVTAVMSETETNLERKDEIMTEAPTSPMAEVSTPVTDEENSAKKPQIPAEEKSQTTPLTYKDSLIGKEVEAENEPEFLIAIEDLVISVDDVEPFLTISEKLEEHAQQAWKFAVVVKLLGKSIGYALLNPKLRALWNPTTDFKVVDMENGFFVVNFKNSDDMNYTLMGGPWVIIPASEQSQLRFQRS